jgi:hypothetical protein
MKKTFMILPLALILCFMVGCQDKDALAKVEEQNEKMTDTERIEIADTVKKLALECAEVFGTLELEPNMKYYLESDRFTFVMNGETTRSYSAYYELVKSAMKNLQEAEVKYLEMYVDVYSREHVIVHGPFKWAAIYQNGRREEETGHMSFVFILHNDEWKIAFATEYFPNDDQV